MTRNIFFLFLTFPFLGLAQSVTFKGAVVDEKSGEPIPYASVTLVSKSSEKVINGTVTTDQGAFSIQTDSSNVRIEISFMGFEIKVINDYSVKSKVVNLGTIKLRENTQQLQEVEVVAEKSEMEFKLEKRVFNVGKDISSTGMGALDVLNNVPSVNVDIEGTVSLRGNAGVQILINGKPSVLADDGSNALGTITADMIERIEVITNPSAKYEAEGTSGIINIILKKEEKKGLNGSLSVNTGIPDNHSIGASINYRTEKFNFFTQFGAGYRSLPRYNENINENFSDSTTIKSDGTEYRNENFYNVTLGTDYYINDYNTVTLSGSFAYEIEDQPSETNFKFNDEDDVLVSEYQRNETTEATNPKYQYDLQYEKQFKDDEEHKLLFTTQGSFFGKDLSSEFINTPISGSNTDPNQRTETDFYQSDYLFKADYTHPFTKQITLEAGGMYEINDVGNDYAVYNEQGNNFVIDSALTNNFEYNQKVLGIYATGAYEGEKWGVKLGLRMEDTKLNTYLINTGQSNNQDYANLFPSVHTSYKVSKNLSFQAGYSRRVFRPRLWDLNPFFNIKNNYNIRVGNPNLQPEFADSYEITGIYILEKASINASIFHLYTTDVVERVTFNDNGVNITTPMNIGTRNSTGFEMNGKYNTTKWLTLLGDFNFNYFVRNGSFDAQNFDFNGTNWSAEVTAKLKLPAEFDIEASGDYRSKVKTVQGYRSGFAFMNAGVRKKLWKGKMVVNVSVRDIFASRIRENIVDQPNFYSYSFSQRGRFFTLGISYSFGKGEAMQYTGRRR